MSVYTLPNRRLFRPKSMAWQMLGNVALNRSPTNGVFTTSELMGDAWTIRVEYGNQYTTEERLELAAFYNRFRGPAHILRIWNVASPEPRGTLRGGPTANGQQVAGWNVISINCDAGATLMAGDMLGAFSVDGYPMLMQCSESIAAGGAAMLNVPLTAPLRRNIAAGAAITWQRPSGDFLILQAPFIPLEPKVSSGFSFEAIEFVR